MKTSLSLLFFLFASFASAQDQDPKAKAILDELSKSTKSHKTITADFNFVTYNKDKKKGENYLGKVQVKGQKFKLEIPGNTIVCDGKTLWNHNKDAAEVTIKNFNPSNDDQLNPTKIFTIYETGYKYKFDKEEKVGNVLCQIIDLYPAVKPEKAKFHTIKLIIDKVKKQVVEVKKFMKDGSMEVYEIKSFKPNLEIADAIFVFDTKGFKADQINDERGD
jgi:outer membrane lipoprotein-sorting protein